MSWETFSCDCPLGYGGKDCSHGERLYEFIFVLGSHMLHVQSVAAFNNVAFIVPLWYNKGDSGCDNWQFLCCDSGDDGYGFQNSNHDSMTLTFSGLNLSAVFTLMPY